MIDSRTLTALGDLAHALAAGWPTYTATEATLAAHPLGSGNNATGGGRSSDVPDPTHSIAVSHARYHQSEADIEQAFTLLRAVQRRMADIRRHHPDTARTIDSALKAARCSGEIDVLCTRNAVRDGLCWGCYQKRRRQALTADHQGRS